MATSTKQKKKHIKAVRPKLRLFRANEPLYSVLMWGVNHSVCYRTLLLITVAFLLFMCDDNKYVWIHFNIIFKTNVASRLGSISCT